MQMQDDDFNLTGERVFMDEHVCLGIRSYKHIEHLYKHKDMTACEKYLHVGYILPSAGLSPRAAEIMERVGLPCTERR